MWVAAAVTKDSALQRNAAAQPALSWKSPAGGWLQAKAGKARKHAQVLPAPAGTCERCSALTVQPQATHHWTASRCPAPPALRPVGAAVTCVVRSQADAPVTQTMYGSGIKRNSRRDCIPTPGMNTSSWCTTSWRVPKAAACTCKQRARVQWVGGAVRGGTGEGRGGRTHRWVDGWGAWVPPKGKGRSQATTNEYGRACQLQCYSATVQSWQNQTRLEPGIPGTREPGTRNQEQGWNLPCGWAGELATQ